MKIIQPILVIIALVAVIAVGAWYAKKRNTAPRDGAVVELLGRDKQEIAAQVEAFGLQLKNVTLLAPTVATDIEREYAAYLSRSLLTSWISHPDRAAGRETSSPWPERIDVIEIEKEDNGTWGVRALLILMTSTEQATGGNAGTAHLNLTVIQEDDAWKIDEYEVLRNNAPNAPLDEGDRPQLE